MKKRIYEWTATCKDDEGETIRLKGEIEVKYNPGDKTGSYARKAAELDAMEGAYKYGLDPDTVEVIDICLIYE